ncbi:hypothetical protein FBQ82_05675 [Anaerolineae bacterium CFX7]|nr:hypothetical protein [Anaerolineae bacterium CFX7]
MEQKRFRLRLYFDFKRHSCSTHQARTDMPNIIFQTPFLQFKSRRALLTAGAILALLALVAIAALNTTATPVSPIQIQIQGWVNNLKDEPLTAARHNAQRNLEAAGENAVPQLLVALRSNNPTQRRNAADVLSYIASPQATDALLQAMRNDPVPAVRRNAAYALGEIQDARALNELQKTAVADTSASVRGAAADSLARVRAVFAKRAGVNEQTIGAYAAALTQPETVYLTAKRDVWVSHDGGKTWRVLANALPSQATALAVSPTNAQELYSGVEGLGLFKSVDGGATWSAINGGLTLTPGARETIAALAIDPANANIVYAARGVWVGTNAVQYFPTGLARSVDGGATWTALNASVTDGRDGITQLAFRNGQLYALAGNRVLTLITPQ